MICPAIPIQYNTIPIPIPCNDGADGGDQNPISVPQKMTLPSSTVGAVGEAAKSLFLKIIESLYLLLDLRIS